MERAELNARAVRTALLAWYDRAARELPWRRTRDPYAIWVSEVMLQQTRVQTVVRYYDRFLARFPTARALAEASTDDVMASWSGLGYYRRARLLHEGVREVVARYGGAVPEELEARRALPGVGRYTAGAIGSIAFGREEPVVDGNVARVLSRLHAIRAPIAAATTQARLWREAERLVRGPRPGDLNQALMELGATLCSKHAPRCTSCPLRRRCRARARGDQDSLPVVVKKRPPRVVSLVGVVATRGRASGTEVWLCKGEHSLFAGLWNLPMVEGTTRRDAVRLLAREGLRGTLGRRPAFTLEHVLSHRKLVVQLFRVAGVRGEPTGTRAAWRLSALHERGLSSLTRKALLHAGLAHPGPAGGLEATARTY
jgi:A/G-specific adenine glycosylase